MRLAFSINEILAAKGAIGLISNRIFQFIMIILILFFFFVKRVATVFNYLILLFIFYYKWSIFRGYFNFLCFIKIFSPKKFLFLNNSSVDVSTTCKIKPEVFWTNIGWKGEVKLEFDYISFKNSQLKNLNPN